MIIDSLYERVREKGPICVGLDTDRSYIPSNIKNESKSISEEIFTFNKGIIDATKDLAACYKLQIAFYEASGLEGLKAYRDTLLYLKKEGLLSIGDIKRGDISNTAKAYAKAHLKGDFEADFITINPYMGFDSVKPYLEYLRDGTKGLFVLIKTSNQGARDIEYRESEGRKIYEIVGDKMSEMGEEFIGEFGYSSLGGVVGANNIEEAIDIRKRYPKMFFLVPGYGAQGGTGEDIKKLMNEGEGIVVNSSRGIITAYKDLEMDLQEGAREATLRMRRDIIGR